LDEPNGLTRARARAAQAKTREVAARRRATQAKTRELAAHRRAEGVQSKRPRRWSAVAALTLRRWLGSVRSAPGSGMPKRSGRKPKRTSGQPVRTASRAATGQTFPDAALARSHERLAGLSTRRANDRRPVNRTCRPVRGRQCRADSEHVAPTALDLGYGRSGHGDLGPARPRPTT
jgi:hypothetical protein